MIIDTVSIKIKSNGKTFLTDDVNKDATADQIKSFSDNLCSLRWNTADEIYKIIKTNLM